MVCTLKTVGTQGQNEKNCISAHNCLVRWDLFMFNAKIVYSTFTYGYGSYIQDLNGQKLPQKC